MVVGLGPFRGEDRDPARMHGVESAVRHGPHSHKPLRRYHRLDDTAGPRAARQGQHVGLAPPRESSFLERLLDRASGFLPIQARKSPRVGVECAIEVQDVDLFEGVPLACGEVVEIVGGRYLDGPGAKCRIDKNRVGDDGNGSVDEWMSSMLAVQHAVTRIVGVDGNGRVTQHRLRAGGRDHDLALIVDRVRELEQFAVHSFVVVDF